MLLKVKAMTVRRKHMRNCVFLDIRTFEVSVWRWAKSVATETEVVHIQKTRQAKTSFATCAYIH